MKIKISISVKRWSSHLQLETSGCAQTDNHSDRDTNKNDNFLHQLIAQKKKEFIHNIYYDAAHDIEILETETNGKFK